MRVHHKCCRGFTLIELVASITIIAILAAVSLPRMTAATTFTERGYADGIAASLRQSRSVAVASGCDVRFTITAAGYKAFQHAAAGTRCAAAGAWSTPVLRGDGRTLSEDQPASVALAANQQFVFAADGTIGAAVTINIGPHSIFIDASGAVSGP